MARSCCCGLYHWIELSRVAIASPGLAADCSCCERVLLVSLPRVDLVDSAGKPSYRGRREIDQGRVPRRGEGVFIGVAGSSDTDALGLVAPGVPCAGAGLVDFQHGFKPWELGCVLEVRDQVIRESRRPYLEEGGGGPRLGR